MLSALCILPLNPQSAIRNLFSVVWILPPASQSSYHSNIPTPLLALKFEIRNPKFAIAFCPPSSVLCRLTSNPVPYALHLEPNFVHFSVLLRK